MELRRALIASGIKNPNIPQVVLRYTLEEDFTGTSTTILDSITSDEFQTFCNSNIGIRGQFEVGKFKIVHFDIKSNVTPASDRSYITHFWFDNYYYFPAVSQFYPISQNVIVPNSATSLATQGVLYTIKPVIVYRDGWVADIQIRTINTVPFNIWKAGTYTMTLSYLGEANYD